MNRRAFLFAGPALLLPRRSQTAIDVRLEPQPGVTGSEIVSFGFPLSPDLLDDPDDIQLLDGEGREIEASVTPLEAWRTSGREGSLRSVLVQARVDFASEKSRRLQVRLHARSEKRISPVGPTPDSAPRVWALLPASWLSASEVAGPQVPASDSGAFAAYDRLAERSFPGSLAYIESPVFHHRPVSPDADPEAGREFWSPRHEAYGFLGALHGFELTGREEYWRRSREYADTLYRHQTQPPDGRPADGSFRQDWGLYDPSESRLPGATSAWMTAILLDALFSYWRLSGDERVPEMVVRWCDFLDRRGLVLDGSRAYYVIDCFGSEAASEASGQKDQGMERHDTEIAASFAMGIFFSRDQAQRERFRRRFDRLFSEALRLDLNRPPRCFNWALQCSSQLAYFLQN